MFGFLKKVFNKKVFGKVLDVGIIISDLLPYAEMGVKLVGLSTGKDLRKISDVIDLLKPNPNELSFDPSKIYTKSELQGILMGAARIAVRGEIRKSIEQSSGAGLMLGGRIIKDETNIPDSVINAAVNTAYALLKEQVDKIPNR